MLQIFVKFFSFFWKILEGIDISLIPIKELFLVTLIEYLASFFGKVNL
jgi:hypothetical protein